jgi:hypothetical protein
LEAICLKIFTFVKKNSQIGWSFYSQDEIRMASGHVRGMTVNEKTSKLESEPNNDKQLSARPGTEAADS